MRKTIPFSGNRLRRSYVRALYARAAAEKAVVTALATIRYFQQVAIARLLRAFARGLASLRKPILSDTEWCAFPPDITGGTPVAYGHIAQGSESIVFDDLPRHAFETKHRAWMGYKPDPVPMFGWQTAANAHQSFNQSIGWQNIVAKAKAYQANSAIAG